MTKATNGIIRSSADEAEVSTVPTKHSSSGNDYDSDEPEMIATTTANALTPLDVTFVKSEKAKSEARAESSPSGSASRSVQTRDSASVGSHGSFSIGEATVHEMMSRIETLNDRLAQAQVDLSGEKAMRRRKEKNLVKIAQELNKKSLDATEKNKRITELEEKVRNAQEKLKKAGEEARLRERQIEEAAQNHRLACREYDVNLAEAKTKQESECAKLRTLVMQANLETDRLRARLAALGDAAAAKALREAPPKPGEQQQQEEQKAAEPKEEGEPNKKIMDKKSKNILALIPLTATILLLALAAETVVSRRVASDAVVSAANQYADAAVSAASRSWGAAASMANKTMDVLSVETTKSMDAMASATSKSYDAVASAATMSYDAAASATTKSMDAVASVTTKSMDAVAAATAQSMDAVAAAKTKSVASTCGPARPGTTLSKGEDLTLEAPWWAPEGYKEEAFAACAAAGMTARSRLVWKGGRLAHYDITNGESKKPTWQRRAEEILAGPGKISFVNGKGNVFDTIEF